jgi:aldehyde dehydrogenase (NAD+)
MLAKTLRSFSTMLKSTHEVTRTQLFINGEYVNSVSGETYPSVDPRTEQVSANFQRAGPADVDKAVLAARNAFDHGEWPRMSGYKRGLIMQKIADGLEKRAEEFAALETLDTGKPIFFSRAADIPLSLAHYRYYAGWADKIHGETLPHDDAYGKFLAYTYKEPIGVAASIIPWNFPMYMAAWKIAPAIATGCSIVLKMSEKTPMTMTLFGEVLQEAGLPAGVVNILGGYGDAGAYLATHAGVDKVAFTGSTATAHKIKNSMGIKPFTAELGGKSPFLVFDDCDLDKAVETTHFGLFFNQGQCCNASSRVLVQEGVYDEFVKRSVALANKRRLGDPFTDTDQGPQVDKLQFDKILAYIQQARDQGATVAAGGNKAFDKGYWIQPTILTNIGDDATAQREEIFGPVMGVQKFVTEEEGIIRANDTNYGLGAGIMSKDSDRIHRVSRQLKAGTVWVNSYSVFDNSTPFGGYKDSGVGRERGRGALDNYLLNKTIIQPLTGDNVGWYR